MNEVLDKKEIRKEILHLEDAMRKRPDVLIGDNPQFPLKHTFAPGVYVREIFIPKGSLIVGKIHKHGHLNVVSKGRVLVVTEFEEIEIDASKEPYTFTSEPGTKRVVYTLEDTVWTTVHLTEETDLEKIENEIIAKDYNDFDLLDNQTKCKEIS